RTTCSGVCRFLLLVMIYPVSLPATANDKTTPRTPGPNHWGQPTIFFVVMVFALAYGPIIFIFGGAALAMEDYDRHAMRSAGISFSWSASPPSSPLPHPSSWQSACSSPHAATTYVR
ncbi:hypothetical protein D9T14_07425, partial [Propionibacterium australiense]|uniref:hypothetical protein n=1 Tax=Propionibacterium australiense TaxID=119981 RepID=UPI000F1AEA7B